MYIVNGDAGALNGFVSSGCLEGDAFKEDALKYFMRRDSLEVDAIVGLLAEISSLKVLALIFLLTPLLFVLFFLLLSTFSENTLTPPPTTTNSVKS